jgi:hypothetical protein
MLLTFDVDCGYLLKDHRFIARGIRDNGLVDGAPFGAPEAGFVPAFSLEYELVPGIEDSPGPVFRYLVGITYTADVPLPWTPTDGGAIAPSRGGPSTHGSRGTWPLPRSAQILRFDLTGIDDATGWPRPQPDGTLTVDLGAGTANWNPMP